MLEKYQKNFDGEKFVNEYMQEQGLTRTQAMAELRRKIPKESYFQTKIMKALKAKYPTAFVRKIAQGNYSEAGMPDILFVMDGHYFGFEVKRPLVGVPSEIQQAVIRQIRNAGGTAEIVRWPEEALAAVDKYMQSIHKCRDMI